MSDLFYVNCGEPATGVPPPSACGAKAHHLMRMASLGLAVPPAVVLGTRFCPVRPDTPAEDWDAARAAAALAPLEARIGRRLADPRRPLLVSVRSGAPVSMPGMMQTLLNVGLTDATLPGLIRLTGNPRLAWDAYRRLVANYGEVVDGIPAAAFESAGQELFGAEDERRLDFAQLRAVSRRLLQVYEANAGRPFPQDPVQQLSGAIAAVFRSWHDGPAVSYRRRHGIADAPGTAVLIQAMVFGNAGGRSGAGVGFTRNPATGHREPMIDYLSNAQGEDVVAGRRNALGAADLQRALPEVWTSLVAATARLERSYADMQDFEFTVEDGRLYLLQTRTGKRTTLAAARIALDLMDEGVIDADEAWRRTEGIPIEALAVDAVVSDGEDDAVPAASAVSAGGGVAVGEIALDAGRVRERVSAGAKVVLVRADAETSDMEALAEADGLLTARGARTSHAAVVARQLGKVCLVACDRLAIDLQGRRVMLGDRSLHEGAVISLDGERGVVYPRPVRTIRRPVDELARRMVALKARFAA